MNAKNILRFAGFVFVLNFTDGALAKVGTESGGGGPGIFCPTPVINQPPVQLLDIYEGRNADSPLLIPENTEPYELQLQNIIKRFGFDLVLQNEFKKNLAVIQRSAKFLPAGVGINAPSDIGVDDAVLLPTGCSLASIGYYGSDGTLKISSDAFNQMSETQKAAFWSHETLYKIIRDNRNEKDVRPITSKSTRVLVAYLFSQNPEWQQLYYLSNECWRNHLYPYDQLGEYWEGTYGTPYRRGIEEYHQNYNLKIKANDLLQFSLQLKSYNSSSPTGTPEGLIQCWDLNTQKAKDLAVQETRSINYSFPTVDYYLKIPSDCNFLQFNALVNPLANSKGYYSFSINIGKTGYYAPIFDRERTFYQERFSSGIQRSGQEFVVRIPIY